MTTGARRPLRILLVDDERRLATTMERWLSEEGHAVEALHDGAAGLRRALDNSHDVLILDVRLPGVDGLEICRRVRAAGGNTPILLCSGRAAVEDRVAGFTAGADDYLIKPFALPELGARVHALGRRPGRGPLRAPDAPPTSQPRPTVTESSPALPACLVSETLPPLLRLTAMVMTSFPSVGAAAVLSGWAATAAG